MSLTQTHDDHLQVILIGPEPRYLVVNSRRTEQIVSGARRLLERIVDRLQADPPPVVTVRMISAVTSGVDSRIRRPAIFIHYDAVRAFDAGSYREFVGSQYANSNNHNVGRMLSAIGGDHGLHAPRLGITNERLNLRIRNDANT